MDALPPNRAHTEPLTEEQFLRVSYPSNVEKWRKDGESQVLRVQSSNISALHNLASTFLSSLKLQHNVEVKN